MNISPGTGTRLLFKRRCADRDLRPLVFRGSARLGSEPKVLAETKSACASWHRFGIMTEIGEIGSGNIRKVKGLDGAHSLDREPFWPLLSTQAQRPVMIWIPHRTIAGIATKLLFIWLRDSGRVDLTVCNLCNHSYAGGVGTKNWQIHCHCQSCQLRYTRWCQPLGGQGDGLRAAHSEW